MAWLLLAAATFAAQAVTDAWVLPAVEVVARRGFDPETGAGSSVDVPATRNRLQDAGDLLAHEAGVTVRRSGGLGAFQSVSIRGAASNQAQMFIDGVPLASSLAGVVPLALLPLDALARIDIYRGTPPTRYARSPLGGAIDFIPLAPEDRSAGIRTAAGSFGSFETGAFAPVSASRANLLLGGAWQRSRGNFEFFDPGGTLLDPTDDRWRPRQNNDANGGNGFVLASATHERWDGRAHLLLSTMKRGLPGYAFAPAAHSRLETRLAVAGAQVVHAGSAGKTGAAVFGGLLRDRLHDPLGEILYAPTDSLAATQQLGSRVSFETRRDAWGFEALAEYERLGFETATKQRGSLPTFRQQRGAISLGANWNRPPWTVRTGGQAERNLLHTDGRLTLKGFIAENQTVGRNLTGGFAGVARTIGKQITLLANMGTGYRLPSALEQFGVGTQLGNPFLKPEHGWFSDLGFNLRATHDALWQWSLDVRGFYQRIYDIIAIYQATPKTTRADNFDSVRSTGLEGETHLAKGGFKIGLNFVRQEIINTGPIASYAGKALPGRPRWEAGSDISYRWFWATIAYQLDWQGDIFLDPVNTAARHIPSRTYHDVSLGIQPWQPVRLTFTVANLSDVRSMDFLGFPLPGRSYQLVLQITL